MMIAEKNRQLRILIDKIDANQATLEDFHSFQSILTESGLDADFILGYLEKVGFEGWGELYEASISKKKSAGLSRIVAGGLVGMGQAVLYKALQEPAPIG